MDDEISALVRELVNMLQETRHEVAALRQVLVDKKLTTEVELGHRIDDVRQEEFLHLKSEALRRAWERTLKDRPKQ